MDLPISMLESFEMNGYFWLPDRETHPVPGKLIFRPNNMLEVECMQPIFVPDSGVMSLGGTRTHPVVYGGLSDGTCVAIPNVQDRGITNFSQKASIGIKAVLLSGGPLSVFQAHAPFTGGTWEHVLFEFTQVTPFFYRHAVRQKADSENPTNTMLSIEPPVHLIVGLDIGPCKLSTELSQRIPRSTGLNICFEHALTMRCEFHSAVEEGDVLKLRWQLTTFFALLTGKPVLTKQMAVSSGQNEKGAGVLVKKLFLSSQDPTLDEPERPDRLMFRSDEFGNTLDKLLEEYFRLHESIRTSLDLFIAVSNMPELYMSFAYAAYSQAAESLYSGMFGEHNYMVASEHRVLRRKLREAYPANLEPDFKQSLDEAIRQSNRYTFKKKISELLQLVSPSLLNFIASDVDFLLDRLVAWRNRIAHGAFSTTERDESVFERDFYSLKLVVHAMLLGAIGADKEFVSNRIQEEYNYLFHQLAVEPERPKGDDEQSDPL